MIPDEGFDVKRPWTSDEPSSITDDTSQIIFNMFLDSVYLLIISSFLFLNFQTCLHFLSKEFSFSLSFYLFSLFVFLRFSKFLYSIYLFSLIYSNAVLISQSLRSSDFYIEAFSVF